MEPLLKAEESDNKQWKEHCEEMFMRYQMIMYRIREELENAAKSIR